MKNRIVQIVAALAVLLFSASAFAQDLRIGYVDLQAALNQVEEGVDARESLEADFERRQEEINEAEQELQAYAEELEASILMMTEEARMEAMQDYQQRLMALQEMFSSHQMELAEAEAEATSEIFENMISIIAAIAEEQGLTLVLEASSVLYAADGNDFTQTLIDRYNSEY